MSEETILLVDDNAVFLRIVRRTLETAGFDIRVACTYEEALSLALTHVCAVAVISLDMRHEAGFEIVRDFAGATPHTECLLLTSNPDVSALNNLYKNNNVYNHIWAPLEDIGDLARQIGRALEHRTLKRQNAYLLSELRDSRDALRSQTEFMIQIEKMASLGVIADHIHQELLLPLTAFTQYSAYLRGKLQAEMHVDNSDYLASMDACLRDMQEAAKQCREIVRTARNYCQESEDEKRLTNLHEVLYEALFLLRHTLEARGIILSLHLTESLPEIVANPYLLRQALVHLLINSIHAMPDGGRITLETSNQSEVMLSLSDTGHGISPEAMPYIFEPFFTTRKMGEGTGLGLSVARSILRQHNGEIQVQSELNRGTQVMIRLPIAQSISRDAAIITNAA
jgi:signal transduction histidine kinase